MDAKTTQPGADNFAIKEPGFTVTGRRNPYVRNGGPLIIAIHGGTYTSLYFDLPGYSLLDLSSTLDITAFAIDRPGYGGSTPLPPEDATILNNARWLDAAITAIWRKEGASKSGVVLIGHSIGAAVTLAIAAGQPAWPLLGVAVSGIALHHIEGSRERWAALPDRPFIEMPREIKNHIMFGPENLFEADMPARSYAENAPTPRTELVDISSVWPTNAYRLAADITVPVHYRLAEFDRLWAVSEGEVADFGRAFIKSPSVDARVYPGAGHCIDLHKIGRAFQLEQLAFALRCSVSSTT